jgi:tripartite-type tricarboxylate transporter receptor subunit TctC
MIARAATMLAAALLAVPAAAQTYPNRPIRYIVGFTPGTATDIVARLVGAKLTERWGQQVIVDNRVGAAGTLSAGIAARSEPDGHTLYMASSTFVVSPFFLQGVTYDIFKDFEPVILMVNLPTVLTVPPQLNLTSVKDLIALAKAKPGQLNYAHSGRGTASQIGAELMGLLSGTELTEVAFKSSTDAVIGVTRGDIAVYFQNLAAAMPYIKQNRIKALAISSAKRSSALPDVPPMADTLPGFDIASFYGIVVPARTPKAVIAKINGEVNTIITQADTRQRLESLGSNLVGGEPAALTNRMKAEREQAIQVVKRIEARDATAGKKP